MTSDTESPPVIPRPGASAVVFRDGQVLLVQRGKLPLRGVWSLPGGHIEPGERALAAAHHELAEETGVEADLKGVADAVDVVLRHDDGSLRAHYVLTAFYGVWLRGEPVAASDAMDARWVLPEALDSFTLTPGAADVILKARGLLEDGPAA
ncbi:MAG: NUDIX hydrolase [Methyloligellaceae bacterium]